MSPEIKGYQQLRADVIDRDLCTLCGACVGMCPYLVAYKGRIVALDDCNVEPGPLLRLLPAHRHRPRPRSARPSSALPSTPARSGRVSERD